jgi:hypothetical protein
VTPEALAARLDGILGCAERLVRHIPDLAAGTLHELGFRLFRRGLIFADAMDRGELADGEEAERPPEALRTTAALASSGATLLARTVSDAAQDLRALHRELERRGLTPAPLPVDVRAAGGPLAG